MIDILERLEQLAHPKPGGGMLVDTENGSLSLAEAHYAVISSVCDAAKAEITRLRATVFGQNARLDQLQSIVGCAMTEPLITFGDIKREARNGK
jgi:hypothetical protein